MVTVSPIRDERDYDRALAEVESLMSAEAGTPEGDRLDVLVTLIEAYERRCHAVEPPDPIALLEFVMEQRGLNRRDLQPFIGSSGRVAEVLGRKRPLSLTMIRRLHEGLGLPAEVLVREYRVSP